MHIRAKQRYKPFTHQPGTSVLLPGTAEKHTFYPEGIEGFTVLLDLEKGSLVTFGKKFRKTLENTKQPHLERLSFGVHKKQEWEGIYKRCNVEEYLPIWYQMAQWYETDVPIPPGSLLEECFQEKDKIRLTKRLDELFKSGFNNLLVPQSTDVYHYGFEKEPLGSGMDPTLLFSLGRRLIRSLFFQTQGNTLQLLPLVPKGIHCGRFLNIQELDFKLDFEWTKHLPRRAVLEVLKASKLTIQCPKEIKSFRIKNLGKRFENGCEIAFPSGLFFFDQFKK